MYNIEVAEDWLQIYFWQTFFLWVISAIYSMLLCEEILKFVVLWGYKGNTQRNCPRIYVYVLAED